MNREQAVEINEHLLGAYEALEHARRAIAGLGKAERLEFGRSLEVVDCALQLGLLRALYDQYPDLEPPEENEESPKITSELRWDKVCLPATLTEAEFDQVILSTMSHHWRKVARIVVDVVKRFEHLGQAINHEMVAARLKVLSDTDRIEGFGDLCKWRHSEVRLKP